MLITYYPFSRITITAGPVFFLSYFQRFFLFGMANGLNPAAFSTTQGRGNFVAPASHYFLTSLPVISGILFSAHILINIANPESPNQIKINEYRFRSSIREKINDTQILVHLKQCTGLHGSFIIAFLNFSISL